MRKNIKNNFWGFFEKICTIPRESGNEKAMADYLEEFAKERNLKCYRDKLNNVVIYKEATDESKKDVTIALQGHLDMVCQKAKGSKHNFEKDPILLIKEKDVIKAKDTTLGADNGIGLSYILSILNEKNIKHPNLECIFTVEEETTMKGALGLDYSKIASKKIISIDGEEETEICIGSMGIREYNFVREYNMQDSKVLGDVCFLELDMHSFKGGHSGIDIGDVTRVNPIKLFASMFLDVPVNICSITGGTRPNAIPAECNVKFAVAKENVHLVEEKIENMRAKKMQGKIILNQIERQSKVMSREDTMALLKLIATYRNGVLEKSGKDMLLTSNFAMVMQEGAKVEIVVSFRNKIVHLAEEFTREVKELFTKNKFANTYIDEYPAYETKGMNDLIAKSIDVYEVVFKRSVHPSAVDGALECGAFSDKIDNLEFIAVGPNIHNAHSIDEYVEIESANKMYLYVVNLIENI